MRKAWRPFARTGKADARNGSIWSIWSVWSIWLVGQRLKTVCLVDLVYLVCEAGDEKSGTG